MTNANVEKQLDEIIRKLEKLERLLGNKSNAPSREDDDSRQKSETNKPSNKNIQNSYKGIVGGVQFLIDNNYLNELRSMREIFEELKREGYYYSLQAVDTSLRRDFVQKKKTLTRTLVNGVWKYAIRK